MIHTVILGADTPDAGELVRILAMHPDVELECAQACHREGIPLSSLHHGLIGETDIAFTTMPLAKRCDVVFDFSEKGESLMLHNLEQAFPKAKVIKLSRCLTAEDLTDERYVTGIPEINRKPLVRGATHASVPTSFASMAPVALYPLAVNLLLNGDISLHFEAPESILAAIQVSDIEKEIELALKNAQMSFSGHVSITTAVSSTRRSALMSAEIPCSVQLDHIKEMYDIYDDHHFAFAVTGSIGASEVAGTEKCVVSLSKPAPDTLQIGAVADCRMRGGAGEAVHIFNLLCGLHERTGLALKAIDFHPV